MSALLDAGPGVASAPAPGALVGAPPRRRAVFVEGLPDLSGEGLGMQLAALARRCLDDGDLFVAEGGADTWSKDYDVKPMLLGAGQALLLQVSPDAAFSFVDFAIPRLKAADRVPGRGFWVQRGAAVKVQVPML